VDEKSLNEEIVLQKNNHFSSSPKKMEEIAVEKTSSLTQVRTVICV
jgi:hypothetical protein